MSQNQNSKFEMNKFFFELRPLCELPEIVESRNIGQIMDLEYLGVNSNVATLIVNFIVVELMDDTCPCIQWHVISIHRSNIQQKRMRK